MERTMKFLPDSGRKYPEKIRSHPILYREESIRKKNRFSMCSFAKDILTILKTRIIHAFISVQDQTNGKKRECEHAG
jgi:hypothetical protein